MAYSILLSLEKIIAEILDHHRFPISPQEEEHIRSINRCVISSQAFLEEFPQKAKKLKERIRDVAAEAEGIIECFLEEEMYTQWKKTAGGIYPLQKVRDEMDSIVAEAADIKTWINSKDDVQFAEPIGTTPSLQAADTAQTDMVGFDKEVVIAGLLSTMSQTVTSWKGVAENIRSSFAWPGGQIEKIFSLSYNDLPPCLRLCFLYLGGFPEDQDVNVTDVIKLWIAESFVKPVGSKEYEDTAEEYLEDLVDRNLVVVTKRKSNGKIRFCRLHNTVRQMCIKKSHDEEFLMHIKDPKGPKESTNDLRRISTCSYGLGNTCSSTIRSIIQFDHMLDSFGSFKLLRILYLLRARSHEPLLSDQLFKLSHLRYLAFYYSHPIPKSISNLQCLQTLIIKEICDPRLPVEIWNMPQLRHLIISKIRLPDTTTATPALENLQTLGKVENLVCSEGTLNLIRNLTKLCLAYSKGSGELLFDNLGHLHRLEKLHLELGFGWFNSGKPPILFTPSSLKQLTLTGWGSRGTYLDIGCPFPNLEVLKLKSFDFELREWRTTDDEDFPQLKYLRIEESDITQWGIGSSHFPRLKTLHIHSCPGMSELPECTADFLALELIELKFCTDSLADSAKLIYEEAISNGNFFQVNCIDCKPRNELMYPSLYEKAMRKAWREQFVAY